MWSIHEPLEVNDECSICGSDIGPSSLFCWHFDDEDCRAVRDPLIGPTILPHPLVGCEA